MSDDDALAIRAYLATVAPVHNAVNVNRLPFPLNIRLAMVFWNALNFTPGRFQPDPRKSAEWNRGAYIVEAQEHCGTCHTPKTILGGDKNEQWLAGGTLQGWFAPDITNNSRKGIGRWSKDDVIQYLKTGTNNWTLASGPMAEAVTHSTSRLMDQDIAAIAAYLKDNASGSAPNPAPVAADDKEMRAGAAIYKDNCAACHRDAGTGEAQLFPHLAGSAAGAVRRSHHFGARGGAGNARGIDAGRADRAGDAGVRLEARGRPDRHRADLYPQQLGQRGVTGFGRRRGRSQGDAGEDAVGRRLAHSFCRDPARHEYSGADPTCCIRPVSFDPGDQVCIVLVQWQKP
ncbi:MAG: hypothetical protein NVS4B4_14180 [Bradyrhizobium sp.]